MSENDYMHDGSSPWNVYPAYFVQREPIPVPGYCEFGGRCRGVIWTRARECWISAPLPPPARTRSVPDTWVTVYCGDMGNTFAVFLSFIINREAARSLQRFWGRARERLHWRRSCTRGWAGT